MMDTHYRQDNSTPNGFILETNLLNPNKTEKKDFKQNTRDERSGACLLGNNRFRCAISRS